MGISRTQPVRQASTNRRCAFFFAFNGAVNGPVPFARLALTRKSQRPHGAEASTDSAQDVRLDKWLWAARFFKMRPMATDAIKHRQIQINGQTPKPSRTVHIGDILRIEKAGMVWTVTVNQLSDRRGSASEAQTLYTESAESQAKRAEQAARNRAEWLSRPQPPEHRPDKRERARLRRLLLKA